MRKEILSAWEHSRNGRLEKEKYQVYEKKLTFNITYHPAFQNFRFMIYELHILLTLNKEHKKIFPNVPVVGFGNGKSLKDYFVRAKLLKLEDGGICEPCRKKTCLICDSISTLATFTTEVCKETFKIQKTTSKKCNTY